MKQYKYHIFHDCQEFSLICETQCSEEIMSELRDSDSDSSLSEDSLETSVRTEQSLVSVAAPDKISCALCVSRTKGKASMDQPSLPHSPSLFAWFLPRPRIDCSSLKLDLCWPEPETWTFLFNIQSVSLLQVLHDDDISCYQDLVSISFFCFPVNVLLNCIDFVKKFLHFCMNGWSTFLIRFQ